MRILNLGSLNLDRIYQLPHFPAPGETIAAGAFRIAAGGKGLNQSVAAARAGAKVFHAGFAGAGGVLLRDVLTGAGVDVSLLADTGTPQGHAVIFTAGGENTIAVCAGSNGCVNPEYIDRALAGFDAGDLLLLQNEIPHVEYAVRAAHKKGLTILYNAAPALPALSEDALRCADWLAVNETEGAALTGLTEPVDILDALRTRLPGSGILLTLGGQGAFCAQGRDELYHKAFPVPVLDTAGAGDTFLGWFAAGLAAGRPLRDILREASAAAAIAVSRAGTAESIPDAAETAAFLAANP